LKQSFWASKLEGLLEDKKRQNNKNKKNVEIITRKVVVDPKQQFL